MDGNKVVLVRSVEDFLNEHVRPELKEVLEEDPWEALTQLAMDPGETIAVSILDEYADKEWTGEDLDLPVEYETVHLSGVGDVENIETTDCREISPGNTYCTSRLPLIASLMSSYTKQMRTSAI